jgi:SAM-dependent methyltransferase
MIHRMLRSYLRRTLPIAAGLVTLAIASPVVAQTASGQYEPKVGQQGKDVVWVPTPLEMVEKMLDLAGVTPKDVVIDLGSGDGRNVIAAAKRGARALGVEFNPDLVEYSRQSALKEGVGDKAKFVQGDMYEADISQATVLALFLLPTNLERLMPKFLALPPGTRIVANTFGLSGWTAEATTNLPDGCVSWCEAMLYIVPARVQGTWSLGSDTLELQQDVQKLSGTLTANGQATPLENGAIKGEAVTFAVAGKTYEGRVKGDAFEGVVKDGSGEKRFSARRTSGPARY